VTTTEWLRERTEHLDIFLFFCSVSDVLFIGGRGVSDCSVLKYYQLNINYLVNILNECLAAVESTAASSPKPITTYCLVLPSKMVMHNAYISRHFWQTKITRIASDVAENLQLYRVGMCGMDFSSSVRFRFGFDKNRGFGSVSVSVRF